MHRSDLQTVSALQIETALDFLSAGKYLLSDLCGELSTRLCGEAEESLNIMRYLIAEKLLEVDLSHSIVTSGALEILTVHQGRRYASYGA
jgi:hypothetical protein